MFQKATWPASGGQEWRRAGTHRWEMWPPAVLLSLQESLALEVCPRVTCFLNGTNRTQPQKCPAQSLRPEARSQFHRAKSENVVWPGLTEAPRWWSLLPASSSFWGSWLVVKVSSSLCPILTQLSSASFLILSLGSGP